MRWTLGATTGGTHRGSSSAMSRHSACMQMLAYTQETTHAITNAMTRERAHTHTHQTYTYQRAYRSGRRHMRWPWQRRPPSIFSLSGTGLRVRWSSDAGDATTRRPGGRGQGVQERVMEGMWGKGESGKCDAKRLVCTCDSVMD